MAPLETAPGAGIATGLGPSSATANGIGSGAAGPGNPANGNGANGGNGDGADAGGANVGGANRGWRIVSPEEQARAFSLRPIYFRPELYSSTADCLTAAHAQQLPLELCR